MGRAIAEAYSVIILVCALKLILVGFYFKYLKGLSICSLFIFSNYQKLKIKNYSPLKHHAIKHYITKHYITKHYIIQHYIILHALLLPLDSPGLYVRY